MRFADLVGAYEKLGATRSRLELRALLVALIRSASVSELPEVLYLSQGLLRPEYEGVELGVADSLLRRAISAATGVAEDEVKALARTTGDLGSTVAELKGRSPAGTPGELDVSAVYATFRAVAGAGGEGSQEVKVGLLTELLRTSSPTEAKYVARFAIGQLRLGVRELTIVDALAHTFGEGTKEARQRIEAAFNLCSDLGWVAQALAGGGLDGLAAIRMTVGRPIRPMLAERSPDLADVLKRMKGRTALEYKYDGLRVQAHLPKDGPARLFSRRLEDISAQFPELLIDLPKAIEARPAIVEGECVSVDPESDEIRPFQDISRRRGRKYDLERIQSEIPVRLFLFDVLMADGEETIGLDFPERRSRLARSLHETDLTRLAIQTVVETPEAAATFFDQSIADGCEGVMAKSLAEGSSYRAGARGFWWIKYKREYTHNLADSIDGVVVGGFYGRGRRAGRFGALLMAVYDPARDRFESFCKVGSGFDDETLAALPERLKPFESGEKPPAVVTGLTPDVWMRPGLVMEIRGAELSLSPIHHAAFGRVRPGVGFALRFPRFTGKFRDDKSAANATTGDELLSLYRSQVRQAAPEAAAGESDSA